eukprot:scaffold155762_cov39-Tisochrysis_lutea.AAC.1
MGCLGVHVVVTSAGATHVCTVWSGAVDEQVDLVVAQDGADALVSESLIQPAHEVERAARVRPLVDVVAHEDQHGVRVRPFPLVGPGPGREPIDDLCAAHPCARAVCVRVQVADGPHRRDVRLHRQGPSRRAGARRLLPAPPSCFVSLTIF